MIPIVSRGGPVRITRTRLAEVLILEPHVYEDERGWLAEIFRDERFLGRGLPGEFRQDNRSHSRSGVVRGLHFQLNRPQGKLVSCVNGRIFDVAVDVRRGSPTLGKWVGVELSGDRPKQLWIPEGFAHGFCVLSETADVTYKCTDIYVPSDERGIRWSDPAVGIIWPVSDPLMSARDRALPTLAESMGDLPEYRQLEVA